MSWGQCSQDVSPLGSQCVNSRIVLHVLHMVLHIGGWWGEASTALGSGTLTTAV